MKIVLVTGGFDPIHSGHISYFNDAAKLGDILVVGVNSDEWLSRKKGRSFMPIEERRAIVENIKSVTEVITFDDSDDSARNAIRTIKTKYPEANIIFANGGDRTNVNIPEMDIENLDGRVTFEFGVGGDNKMNSSSWILQEWKAPKTERQWGYYRVLHEDGDGVKVKELTVEPGRKLSMQRHEHRNEIWFISEGVATVKMLHPTNGDLVTRGVYYKDATALIAAKEWHQLCNREGTPLKVIEIQYGEKCDEEDIERKDIS